MGSGQQVMQQVGNVTVERWVPSTCGMCSIRCGGDIAATQNEIVGVRGQSQHVVNAGRLGPKGLNQYFANRHPSRARVPLVRRPDGELRPTSWDDAMDLVVARFNHALATEG